MLSTRLISGLLLLSVCAAAQLLLRGSADAGGFSPAPWIHWDCEEGSGTTCADLGTASNTLNLLASTNDPDWLTSPGGLDFDINDAATATTSPNLAFHSQEYTICTTSARTLTSGTRKGLIGEYDGQGWKLDLNTGGVPHFSIFESGSNRMLQRFGSALGQDVPTFICVALDTPPVQSTTGFYVDGAAVSFVNEGNALTGDPPYAGTLLQVGTMQSGGEGLVKTWNVLIWQQKLDSTEIAAACNEFTEGLVTCP